MHENIQLPTFELPIPEVVASVAPPAPPLLRTLSLSFDGIPLYPRQIAQWRGAVVETLKGLEALSDVTQDIFHNHTPVGTMHRPAFVQYRCSNGKAILWGMNEGADALARWISVAPDTISVGGRTFSLNPVGMQRTRTELKIDTNWHYFRLHDYLALNTENYQLWLAEHGLVARTLILERALTSHVLAFCQDVGWWLNAPLKAELVEVHSYKKVNYHKTDLIAFEMTYRCNIALPEGISLGKATSHGFGVQLLAPKF